MKKIVVILCFLGSVFCSQAFAEEVVQIATTDFPPYEFQVDNKLDGISVKIVEEVFKKMNRPVSISLLPWSRGLKYLEDGEIDGLFEVLKKEEREKYAMYSNVVLMEEIVSLFVLEESDIVFDGDLSKLKDYTFGVRQDFSYGTEFDKMVETKVISKTKKHVNAEKLFLLLNAGYIDILIGDQYGIPHLYNKVKSSKKLKNIKKLYPDVQSIGAYMTFTKKRDLTELRDNFDKVLLEMKDDGTYNAIINNWEQISDRVQ